MLEGEDGRAVAGLRKLTGAERADPSSVLEETRDEELIVLHFAQEVRILQRLNHRLVCPDV